jgi:RNA recognition motif-containing protein
MAEPIPREVHVSNLNYRTVDQSLRDAFAQYGDVTNARIIMEPTRWGERRSRGFGFVEFAKAEAAAAAAAANPPIELDGRTVRVRRARPRKRDTIFVSGIPKGTTQDDLRAVFGKYGSEEIRIVREDSSDHRGFAFIKFDTEEHQTAAHHANRVFQLKGSESRVQFARRNISGHSPGRVRAPREQKSVRAARDPQAPRPPRPSMRRQHAPAPPQAPAAAPAEAVSRPRVATAPKEPPAAKEIYVSNLTCNTSARELGEAFVKYGEVVNARIVTRVDRFGTEQSMGFGFVEFATAEAAAAAIAVDPPIELDERPLKVALANRKLVKTYNTIHVSGIPKGTTQDDLKAVFAKYNVVDVRIVHEDSEERKGFAYVQFDSEEHQTAAQTENKVIRLKGEESQVQLARKQFGGGEGRYGRRRKPARAPEDGDGPPSGGSRPPRGGMSRAAPA